MSAKITAIRGMNDILPIATKDNPVTTARWQAVEKVLRQLMHQYGYREIRLPIVENTPLFFRAIGSPAVILNKSGRLISTLFNTFYLPAQNKRLQRLKQIGFIEQIPSQKQLWFGAYDMLRYFISPGAASYYKTKNINFTFHQVLRFLNDPSGISLLVAI